MKMSKTAMKKIYRTQRDELKMISPMTNVIVILSILILMLSCNKEEDEICTGISLHEATLNDSLDYLIILSKKRYYFIYFFSSIYLF